MWKLLSCLLVLLTFGSAFQTYLDRVKRIWYLSPMRAAKVQASLRIRAVSPEPPLLAHTSSESRGTFRQKTRSLVPLNGWACAVEICHDGMLEDTNSLDGAHFILMKQTLTKSFWDLVLIFSHLPVESDDPFKWLSLNPLGIVILKYNFHVTFGVSSCHYTWVNHMTFLGSIYSQIERHWYMCT